MADDVPVSREDGPGTRGTAQGTDAVSGATAQQIDRAALGAAFPRTHHILLLEFGDRKDFDDPRKEWRRLFSELLGTFALVLAAAGGGLLHAKGQISLAAAVVAPGLMVMAIILFMGAVSGAHLNPAVSLAFALRGDFPWKRVPGYIVTQLIGATLACLFLRWVFGNVEHLGATLPGPGYQNWQALLMEIVLTALLVSVILGTASAAQNVGAIAALGVGGYIALAGLWAAPVSGVSMNPARSFGPALASGYWTSYWVYLVGPVTGALIAVGFAFVLRGRGGDVISRAAGSGVLDEGALTAKAKLSQDIEQGKAVPPGITGTDTQRSGPMTGAALTNWNDDPPDRPSLTPSHSKPPVSPDAAASRSPQYAARWRSGHRRGPSRPGKGMVFRCQRHSRRRAAGTAISHRSWIHPGQVPPHRAGPGRTRARRWPGVCCAAGWRGRRLEAEGPPVLAVRVDLGEFHLAPRLLAQPRPAGHDLPARR